MAKVSEKLLPCPFCGGEAIVSEHYNSMWRENPTDFCVRCKKCLSATMRYYSTRDKAIAAWNRRAERTGRWVGTEYSGYADGSPVYDTFECSNCREEHYGEADALSSYCPHCGARMIGGEDDG